MVTTTIAIPMSMPVAVPIIVPAAIVVPAAIPMTTAMTVVVIVDHAPRQPEHHPQQQHGKTTHDRLLSSR